MALRDFGVRLVVANVGGFRSDMRRYNDTLDEAAERNRLFASSARAIGASMAAVGGAVTALGLTSVKAASDLGESVNAVNVVFGEAADTILQFSENSARVTGLATADFNQLAAVTGALLADTGLSMEGVADQTNILAVRAADMASVMNTDVKDALFAINAALRGETEPIRRYTGDVTDATLEQFLLSQGIDRSVRDLTEQEKRLLRLQVVLQDTNKFAGDFERTSGELANSMRITTAEFTNARAELGEALIPIIQDVVSAVAPLIARFAQFAEENPKLVETLFLIGGAVGAVGIAVTLLTPLIVALAGGALLLGGALLPVIAIIAGITAVIAAGLIIWRNWGTIVEFVKEQVNNLIEFINTLIRLLFRVNPLLAGLEAFGLISTPQIPTFANGGTMRRSGVAMVGERGPELVTLPAGAQVTPISRINEVNVQATYTNPQDPQSIRNDMEFLIMSMNA